MPHAVELCNSVISQIQRYPPKLFYQCGHLSNSLWPPLKQHLATSRQPLATSLTASGPLSGSLWSSLRRPLETSRIASGHLADSHLANSQTVPDHLADSHLANSQTVPDHLADIPWPPRRHPLAPSQAASGPLSGSLWPSLSDGLWKPLRQPLATSQTVPEYLADIPTSQTSPGPLSGSLWSPLSDGLWPPPTGHSQ